MLVIDPPSIFSPPVRNLSSCEQMYERKLKNLLQAKKEFERLLFGGPSGDNSYATPFVSGSEGIFPRIPVSGKICLILVLVLMSLE